MNIDDFTPGDRFNMVMFNDWAGPEEVIRDFGTVCMVEKSDRFAVAIVADAEQREFRVPYAAQFYGFEAVWVQKALTESE